MNAPRTDICMKLGFHACNGDADRLIEDLMALVGGIERPALVRELILSALKAGQEDDGRVDLKLMNSALKEMRYSSKVFSAYRDARKVSVFGSARIGREDPRYRMAVDFGRQLAKAGFMVITGGGPGIMQAVNEGAGPEQSFGINIRLPHEQKPNPVIEGLSRSITYKYFFNRKVTFIKEAAAVALFPGGFGTLDEGMEIFTLIQTGKHDPMPLLLLDTPDGRYWDNWLAFLESELLSTGLIGPQDLTLVDKCVTAEAAVACIERFYHRYHSLRYVDGQTVLRLNTPLADRDIQALDAEFSDLLVPGTHINASCALPPEHDDPDTVDLPRLCLQFNRIDTARLRQMIDRINAL
jgi:uncharacterized protein (TIGR00730 family)